MCGTDLRRLHDEALNPGTRAIDYLQSSIALKLTTDKSDILYCNIIGITNIQMSVWIAFIIKAQKAYFLLLS